MVLLWYEESPYCFISKQYYEKKWHLVLLKLVSKQQNQSWPLLILLTLSLL